MGCLSTSTSEQISLSCAEWSLGSGGMRWTSSAIMASVSACCIGLHYAAGLGICAAVLCTTRAVPQDEMRQAGPGLR